MLSLEVEVERAESRYRSVIDHLIDISMSSVECLDFWRGVLAGRQDMNSSVKTNSVGAQSGRLKFGNF